MTLTERGRREPATPALEDATLSVSRIQSSHPLHEPRLLSVAQRERFRKIAKRSREQALLAAAGGLDALHAPNKPRLQIDTLIPALTSNGLRALSLFSGGGGLDLGFERAGYLHVASYELLEHAAATLRRNRDTWDVFGGDDGDVTRVKWSQWKGAVDVLHGGPPCQPFSNAGRQRGALDPRDCWPATIAAIRAIQPHAFVAENVPALAGKKFTDYVHEAIDAPLTEGRQKWHLTKFFVEAKDFGVPQVRRRFVIVGFRSKAAHARFTPPKPTHWWGDEVEGQQQRTMGVRHALGLPEVGDHPDGLAPTIRSGLTGPRFTTSVCNSTSAARTWASLGLWPNGVAATRAAASAFPTDSGAFRLSVADVALIQGFPASWWWPDTVYKAVGQIGNAVAPPVGYAVANAVTAALTG